MIPVLDTTSEFNIRMIEGDPIAFSWILEDEDWSGAYTFKCATPGGLVTIAVTAVLNAGNTVFNVISGASALLTETTSGHPWSLKLDAGITRLQGLLFVDAAVSV